ncbi:MULTISPECIES: DUF3192 domain-containing protein [Colwellia]|uniref:DUF3192 domain-containing protein n=1 Tax=Colwellia psychrerythraea (strain 34H / ATCC BAA-681) TaxID=167879 RepID=Q47YA7_COLP3|nr:MULTISPECIES: DUF3192 domain-containing protein [Colwellia]AAZ24210.1 hypothetical protein CPS_3539 [Colwellia psychrerythraea 34H]PKH86808.1 DUF3192 domain-containing protein [Colwellia sp. Bg11-28]
MNKKIIGRILLALTVYGIFVALVMTFYDDSPDQMKWKDREAYNRQFIAKVMLDNFTFEQALTQLGSPDITEARTIDKINYQVMFYRTQHVKSDGITTQDECTFLLFVNGTLKEIGLGNNYPEQWGIVSNHVSVSKNRPIVD